MDASVCVVLEQVVVSKMVDMEDIEREAFNLVDTLGAQHLKEVCQYLNVSIMEGNNTTSSL